MLYHDETIVQIGGSKRRMWGPKGKISFIPNTGNRTRVVVSGIVDVTTGKTILSITEEMKTKDFINYLIQVLTEYPIKIINLVVDNASWHKSKELQPFLEYNKRLNLIYLPPYSPDLNPIEKLWYWLKKSITANTYYKNIKELRSNILDFAYSIGLRRDLVLRRLGFMCFNDV